MELCTAAQAKAMDEYTINILERPTPLGGISPNVFPVKFTLLLFILTIPLPTIKLSPFVVTVGSVITPSCILA